MLTIPNSLGQGELLLSVEFVRGGINLNSAPLSLFEAFMRRLCAKGKLFKFLLVPSVRVHLPVHLTHRLRRNLSNLSREAVEKLASSEYDYGTPVTKTLKCRVGRIRYFISLSHDETAHLTQDAGGDPEGGELGADQVGGVVDFK